VLVSGVGPLGLEPTTDGSRERGFPAPMCFSLVLLTQLLPTLPGLPADVPGSQSDSQSWAIMAKGLAPSDPGHPLNPTSVPRAAAGATDPPPTPGMGPQRSAVADNARAKNLGVANRRGES
jgi:hypothetical protein